MLKDIETLSISIDINTYDDRYIIIYVKPQGTFYILVVSPLKDDRAFCRLLSKYNILCLPGSVCMIPGYFRVCLTANENLIDPTNIESKNPERKMIVKHQFMKALYYELFLIPRKNKYNNFAIVLIFFNLNSSPILLFSS
jgi:hypothetical protein